MAGQVRFFLPCDFEHVARAQREARSFLERRGVASERIYAIEVALEELVSNVVRHGLAEDDPLRQEIMVGLSVQNGVVRLHVEDDGWPFDPTTVPPPDMTIPLGEWSAGGLGLRLTRNLVRDLRYRRCAGRNCVDVTV